ncbi:MAG: Flp pilus assembly complex ATPase component TadA [Lachnospiraceae bacterium]|jgi:type IV pilus assembly protein PilB|nr:Flp pilus assembly complex ATPase component TadA [Lachnospiraceae bacterium]MCI1727733.1 Flp pilus assembly complex ATPase component TadA [Lachnospiraceae bacterium]
MIGKRKIRLGELLLQKKVITQDQLDKALSVQQSEKKKLGEVLTEMGFVTEEQIMRVLSQQLEIPSINLTLVAVPDDIVALVNPQILRKHVMIPFEYAEGKANTMRVAMADPMDELAIDDFSIITNMQVEPVLATSGMILQTLDKYYGNAEALVAAEKFTAELEKKQDEEAEAVNEEILNSPIVQLVKVMIEQAARQRASDIHVEAGENKVRVRYRIDGALYERFTYDLNLLPAIVARIKIISGMDISEKRKPQDGRLTMAVDRKEYDVRVSVLPTVYGEKVVMRLAQKKALTKSKQELGFKPDELAKFDRILQNPNGIILATGPTGSGKSTTLYTALSELNKEDVNIITVEDPVEANIDGINQVQVNTKADLTFANALRSILRQDPDIIMIGEIRDEETAQIAVQASITGHLVVSTLHTNSAAATITRLIDMGIESYLLADAMAGVIAQRLVRRLCEHCKKPRPADEHEKELLCVPKDQDLTIYEPCGCSLCNDTGYYGRIGVYEIMPITHDLKEIISAHGTTDQIRETALKDGMKTLRMAATELVLDGTTSITEMLRVSFEN